MPPRVGHRGLSRRARLPGGLTPTLVGSGTTPPTVTLAELGFLGVPILVTVTTAGAVGVAAFTYKIGAQAAVSGVATAASVALGSSGVTILFSAGTYAANNVYTGTA